MTILQRAATLAIMTFSIAGLAMSAPGKASELGRTTIGSALVVSTTQALFRVIPAAEAPVALTDDPASPIQPAVFQTLDAAIAAQDTTTDEDARCLAGAVYFEAKGEPLSGQLAVAQVVINRARSGRFPPSVCSVVTQRGQFSFVHSGTIPQIDGARAAYRTALAVAKVALHAAWDSQAPDALYFHARKAGMSAQMTKVASIGNHVFYR